MKPAPFEYCAPRTIDEALSYLAQYGYDAKVLAGGQSLIPLMNFRLAQPSVIIDLNNINQLFFIEPEGDDRLRIGAMARHYQVEESAIVEKRAPLIHETMPLIATVQVRTRGTFGGSLSHADPSAELTAVTIALDGTFLLRSQKQERWVPANEFFVGLFTSVLQADELFIEAKFPALPKNTGCAIVEVARRPHDFALVGVAATITLDDNNICRKARLVLFSVEDKPIEAIQAENLLINHEPSPALLRAAAETAAKADIDPGGDIHATAAFRRHLASVLTFRALETAAKRARNGG